MSAGRPSAGASPGAIDLIEESVHLLRGAPAGVLALYYVGSAPFVLGVLFFWAYTTWFTPPAAVIAWAACGLVLLFAAMKAAHAEFCSRLMDLRMGADAPPWTLGAMWRLASGQMRLQAWGLLLLPLAMAATVPFGWTYAYFQSLSVLGRHGDAHALALGQARLWPGQNHLALLFISVLGLTAWANLAAVFWLVPIAASHFLGIENIFGFSGWWQFNTTFLASVTGLAWLVADPLVKAFYTLRVFYGRARSTGEDLLVELGGMGARGRTLALLVLVAALPAAAPRVRAAEAPLAAEAVGPRQLDASIDGVLAGSNFQWRLRQPAGPKAEESDGPLKRFVRQGVEMLASTLRAVGRLINEVIDWLRRLFPRGGPEAEEAGQPRGGEALRIALYAFAAGAILLIAVVAYLAWKRGGERAAASVAAAPAAPAAPRVADEGSHAGQLPADGWLALARGHMERGEWRLVLRALYLATLARLAAEGLVTLAKFKTNLDYEREVGRRALGRKEVVERFSARRGKFESTWYGQAAPDEAEVRGWLAELERPGSP